jgi:hypothetical protein
MGVIFFSILDLEREGERERRKRKKANSMVMMATLEEFEEFFLRESILALHGPLRGPLTWRWGLAIKILIHRRVRYKVHSNLILKLCISCDLADLSIRVPTGTNPLFVDCSTLDVVACHHSSLISK